MELAQMDQNGNNGMQVPVEPSVPLLSRYERGIYGDPEVLPHVGDEHQVEIPALLSKMEHLAYTKNPIDEENKAGLPCNFLMGLPISLIWVHQDVAFRENENKEVFNASKSAAKREGFSGLKFEPFDAGSEVDNMETDDMEEKIGQVSSFLVPGSSGSSWSDVEKASILLALYIFDKNFVQVKKFVESKSMGEIMLYYYGSFWRSDEYWIWSECLKAKGKKCAYGQRLFSGLRQQELLSRLVRDVSEECQSAMMEVSRTFGNGRISLEEYVLSLKAMVGMSAFVDAVGIGRGKQDLTSPAIEPSKANQAIRIRPEIPIGKACASLSPSEIIDFLTGNYRLSKARSNDLFWEAVWPRLLARGWHSEQPGNHNYAGNSKNQLVFLMPGVAKYSRRSLVNGDHFFDSITDVLNKVASEPGLLDLDRGENEVDVETVVEEDENVPEKQRHSYLQPRIPSGTLDMMNFTVVDTSLAEGKTFEVRDLKALPLEISAKHTSRSHSDEDPPEVSTDESDCAYTMHTDEEIEYAKIPRTKSDNVVFSAGKNLEGTSQNGIKSSHSHSVHSPGENCKSPKVSKANATRGLEDDHLENFASVGKRCRRLTACSIQGTNQGMSDWMSLFSDTTEESENILSLARSCQAKLSNTSSNASSSRDGSTEHIEEHTCKKPKIWPVIDLNKEPTDSCTGVFTAELTESPEDPCTQSAPIGVPNTEEQVNVNSRRQSSRNRPPTARALEAFAHGFLSINSRKVRGDDSRVTSRPRNSRRLLNPKRLREEVRSAEFGTGDDASGTNSNMLENFQGTEDRTHVSDP